MPLSSNNLEKPILLIVPYEGYTLSGKHVASIYLKPLIEKYGSEAIGLIDAPQLMNSLDFSSIAKPLVIGSIPQYIRKKKDICGNYVHIIVDKYILNAYEPEGPWKRIGIASLLRFIYAGIWPAVVFVNNMKMKSDFEVGFVLNGVNVDVRVLYHPVPAPVSYEPIKKYGNMSNCMRPAIRPGVALLQEGAFTIKYERMDSSLASFIKTNVVDVPWYEGVDQILEKSGFRKIMGIVNYRMFSSSLHERDGVRKNILRRSSQGRRSIFRKILVIKVFDVLFGIKARMYGVQHRKLMINEINSLWKPSTKVSSAIAQGLPLITEYEVSLSELSSLLDFPIFIFNGPNEFIDACNKLLGTDEIVRNVEANRSEWIKKLSLLYLSQVDAVLEKVAP